MQVVPLRSIMCELVVLCMPEQIWQRSGSRTAKQIPRFARDDKMADPSAGVTSED
jgi:hypothetical protein